MKAEDFDGLDLDFSAANDNNNNIDLVTLKLFDT